MQLAKDRWDTKTMWRAISKCIERGIIDVLDGDPTEKLSFQKHGKPTAKQYKLSAKPNPHVSPVHKDPATQSIEEHASGEGKEGGCNR